MSSQLWSRFRKIRAVIFALSTLLSIAWTVIFTILLLREWGAYNVSQRATIIVLLLINGVSSILMYLMIVVRFTLWIDAARVTLILFFQLGGTIAFALLNTGFPCDNIGSVKDCKNITSAVIMGGWTLSGLLLLYAFLLVVMSYVPPSTPPPSPEEALPAYARERSLLNHSPTPSIKSETYLLKADEKHWSVDSTSFYCRGPHTPSASLAPMDRSSLRSISSHGSDPRSPAVPTRSFHAPLHPQQVLPNPFTDPVPRHTSPLSQASVSSSWSDNREYAHTGRLPRTPGLGSPLPHVYRAGSTFPPPYMEYMEERRVPYRSLHPSPAPFVPKSPGNLAIPSTPILLRPAVQATIPFRTYTSSPGFQSVHSMSASMHSPNRRESFSISISGVPSPVHSLVSGLPSSPRPVAFPPTATTPSMTEGVAQIRRFGSESNITLDGQNQGSRTPDIYLPSALRVARPDEQPNWVTPKSGRNVDFKQWKEAVLGAAAGGQFGR